MEKLYSIGDEIDGLHVLKNSTFSIRCEGTPSYQVALPQSYPGIFEFLLSRSNPSITTRLSEVIVDDVSKNSALTPKTLLESLYDSEEGSLINKTLAILIEQSNQTLQTLLQSMPEQWDPLQKKARLFFELTNSLSTLAEELGIGHIISLARDYSKHPTYIAGSLAQPYRVVGSFAATGVLESNSVQFTSEQVFCHQGHEADSMFFLLKGKVLVSSSNYVLASIDTPGECFGELAFFLGGKRTANLTATSGSAVLRVTKESLPDFLIEHPDMLLQIAQTLAQRLEQNFRKISFYSKPTVEELSVFIDACHRQSQTALETLLEDLRKVIRVSFNEKLMKFIHDATSATKKLT